MSADRPDSALETTLLAANIEDRTPRFWLSSGQAQGSFARSQMRATSWLVTWIAELVDIRWRI